MATANSELAVSPSLLRIMASMGYDSLLLAAISIGYGAIVTLLGVAFMGSPPAGQHLHFPLIVQVLISLIWVLILMGFYVYFWCRFGQSLGMKTWRIQVVDANSLEKISLQQAVRRSAWAWPSLLLAGAGYWFSLVHPKGRLLHDLLTGTRLVLLKKSK